MRENISRRLITSLEPKSRNYDVRDSRLKGFFVRVQPTGHMSYYCEYARGKKFFIGKADALSPDQARDIAIGVLAEAAKGQDPIEDRRAQKTYTLKEFLEKEYGPWVEAHRKDGKATHARLKRCLSDFRNKSLNDITPWLIEKWRSARLKKGVKPSTINRDLAAIKSSMAKAVEWGLLKEHSLVKVKPTKIDTTPKVRFLTHDEEPRLREALDQREKEIILKRNSANIWRQERGYPLLPNLEEPPFTDALKPMVLLSINTGLRRGELFNLKWKDVDLSSRMLTVAGHTAKSGRTRHIPLNDEALETLKAWNSMSTTEDLIFPGKEGKPMNNTKRSWKSLLEKAEIKNFRWHDLRHHFASRLVMAGVDLNTVRDFLGHGDIKMTLRYAHLAPEHKAAAIAKLTPITHKETINEKGVAPY